MKKKPFLVRLLCGILTTVLVIAVIVGVGCIYINKKFGINVFETYSQVKILSQPVDENKKFTNKFSSTDMAEAQTNVNAKISGLITYTEENGYKVSTEGLTAESNLTLELLIADKQLAAIADVIIKDQTDGMSVEIGGEKYNVELVQIQFSNIDNETGSADVNVVAKIDISSIQEQMKGFPLNLFSKYIPKVLYISSTTTVTKLEGEFNYSVTSKELTLNNLNKAQTSNIVKLLDMVAKTGSADDLNQSVGQTFMDLLIGNETTEGFVYSLKSLGAKDYSFRIVDEVNYLVIKP